MFSGSAELYDLIYAGLKDYQAETAGLVAAIRELHPEARTVLDVACGTGEHARFLEEEHGFLVDGIDLDPTFVSIAQRKLSRGTAHQGDMTDFELPSRYDVVLCLFGSIGYVRTLENLRRAFERFRYHLTEGGIALVEPWFRPGGLQPGRVTITTAESEGVTVSRMSHCSITDRISRLRFEYLIGRSQDIEHVVETHELGLFSTEEMLEALRQAGFEAEYDPKGSADRGLYTARVARAGGTT